MEPPRENSPSTPSRYLNSYLQQNSSELFHQSFPQRQLSNQQFYAAAATADNLSTNNKNYLKRHHSSYDKNESERDKKYDKKMVVDDQAIHQTQAGAYDGFTSDAYTATSTGSSTAATTTPQQKSGANSSNNNTKCLSNGKKTKGRVKIKMEYIDNKLRRYTTFSKRKTGIMKKVSLHKVLKKIMRTVANKEVAPFPFNDVFLLKRKHCSFRASRERKKVLNRKCVQIRGTSGCIRRELRFLDLFRSINIFHRSIKKI
jgi:hypothetical protein